jgi:hypothetical protein
LEPTNSILYLLDGDKSISALDLSGSTAAPNRQNFKNRMTSKVLVWEIRTTFSRILILTRFADDFARSLVLAHPDKCRMAQER